MSCGGGTQSNNGTGTNNGDCVGGKCDSTGKWVEENLADRNDPIANFLRTQAEELDENDGALEIDYQRIQFGVAEVLGCGNETAANYIISDELVVGSTFPRLVGTVCSKDETKNWQFFASPPDANADQSDLDVHVIEMFAWDPDAAEYRFYKAEPVEEGSGELRINVGPDVCATCHLGPRPLDVAMMPMLPIMNELTQPWEHWNAQPGFDSQAFEVPEDVKNAPHYQSLTGASWKASARDLELIIRAAHTQVAEARVKTRREGQPASVTTAMSLLRPLFCDEQINFASEAGTGGQLLIDVVADQGLRDLVKKKVPTGWGQKWLDPGARLRIPAPGATDQIVNMIPVRGHAMTSYENLLASVTRGIDVDAAIQIRALDYENPVFSDVRCGLWVSANERFQRQQLDVDLAGMRHYELIPLLVEEIMQVEGTSLLTGEPGKYHLLNDGANLTTLVNSIKDGAVPTDCSGGVCATDLTGLVDAVEAHVLAVEADPDVRQKMWEERQRRACIALACYENHPFIPNTEGCSQECPLGAALSSN